MAVNLTAYRDLLWPGLAKVTSTYPQIPTQYSKLFNRRQSTKAMERAVTMRTLGLAAIKVDGGTTVMDNNAGQRFMWNVEMIGIGLGFAVTRNAIDDNQYKSEFVLSAKNLLRSHRQTKEIYAANVLNTASTYNAAVGGDKVALCSTAHPYDQGTWANRPSIDVDLNEATLLAAQTQVRSGFVDEAGLKIQARGKKLIVPVGLRSVAVRLLKSEMRPGTNDNDVNVFRADPDGLGEDFMVMDFLTSNFAWFLRTDIDGLVWYDRKPFETDMHTDFATDNLLVKSFERYAFSYNDPRAIWGSFPTS